MKNLLILAVTFFISTTTFSQEEKTISTTEITTYYFIRHAEKDRSDIYNRNPHLNEAGKKRAIKWSEILGHISFDEVYSTDYNRTKETAQPTATKNNLEVKLYDHKSLNAQNFIYNTKRKTVLIVGHSNTTPQFVNTIIGYKKYKDIDDSNNGNLYIVTFINAKKTDQLLTIN